MNIADVVENVELELLSIPEGRIELTKYNPLLFALIYLPHHLQNSKGEIT
jgi:hypothetical protein